MTEENKEEIPKPSLIEDLGMLYPTENSKHKTRFGIYECGFCGTEFRASTNSVQRGNTKSCGCYRKKITGKLNKTHGLGRTRLCTVWRGIKDRTLNPKNKQYKYYGDRGITICEEWKNDFMTFYEWARSNGYEENKGLSIDRINNDGNYCPENCRWTTQTIQIRNRRIRKDNTSGYKGVYYSKDRDKYMSYITVDKNGVFLGVFPTAEEGAIAYNNYIIENNLEGFILNEIPEVQECSLN